MTKDKYEVEETWVARDGGDDERMAEAEEEEEECKIREDDGDAAAAAGYWCDQLQRGHQRL